MRYLYRKSDEYSITVIISQTFIEVATTKSREYAFYRDRQRIL